MKKLIYTLQILAIIALTLSTLENREAVKAVKKINEVQTSILIVMDEAMWRSGVYIK